MGQDEGMTFNYDDEFYDGALFSTMRDLKSTFMEYAMDNNFAYKLKRQVGEDVYFLKCAHSMCNWRLRAIGHDYGVHISRLDKKHMCGGLTRVSNNKHVTCL